MSGEAAPWRAEDRPPRSGAGKRPRQRLEALTHSFHCLEDCPREIFVDGFDAEAFVRYAGTRSSAGVDAAYFILAVWNSNTDWREHGMHDHRPRWGGRFALMDALPNWDERMRDAFAAWAADPWWC